MVIGTPSNPMSPMSWYSGSHDATRSCSSSNAAPRRMASMFAVTQRCGSITPLGSAVLPLVNCRIASASGSTVVGANLAASPCSSSRLVAGIPSGTNAASWGSTSTIDASALATRRRVASTNSSIDPSRIGSGSMATVAPVSQVAWIAVTSAREVGPRSPTVTPGPAPRAWSAAAMARASSCSCDQGTVSEVYAGPSVAPVTKVMVPDRSAASSSRAGNVSV